MDDEVRYYVVERERLAEYGSLYGYSKKDMELALTTGDFDEEDLVVIKGTLIEPERKTVFILD